MARVSTKIGDVFSVRIDKSSKKYFQLIAFDLTQLNSDVIRAFKDAYPIDTTPDLSEIVNGEIDFYAHCITRLGLKMNLWEKIGNNDEIGDTIHVLFRGTEDSGKLVDEEPIQISEKWYVWNINEKFRDVGKLKDKNREAEIGVIVNPYDIVERIKTGKYNFFYPGFE